MTAASVDPREVEKFSRIAAEWWDPFGKFKPLHKFNPVRLAYIRDQVCDHFGRDRLAKRPFEGLRLLDVGCGGGLAAEPMRRLGAEVVAIDASETNARVAAAHAAEQNLDIDYRAAAVEDLVAAGEAPFDVVLNLEVVEHVVDVSAFLAASAQLIKPGGVTIVATLNRTLKALALAKVGAEYILRWLPMGAHDWRKFQRPEELRRALEAAGLEPAPPKGVVYNPLLDAWSLSGDVAVNYMMTATKPQVS